MENKYLIQAARIVTPSGIISGSILVTDGRLARVGQVQDAEAEGAQVIDATGRFILPGLIDLHVQGAGGGGLLERDPQTIERVCRSLASFGTTAFLATTVVDTTTQDQRHIRRIAEGIERRTEGARILGIHLEGPFISIEKRGMIQEDHIHEPSMDYYERVKEVCGGHLRMMTIAPELPGAIEIIKELVDSDIIASLGHTNATYAETLQGIEAGLSHVTHVGNAMRSLHHREPGAFGAVLISDALTMQIIADGIHLHPDVVAWLIRLKGPSRFVIITDGIPAMGMPPGQYDYGGLAYTVENGAARYLDGTLIGTAHTQLELVRLAMDLADLSLHEAINMASLYPARIAGVDESKGSIEEGKDADLVICDNKLSVETVLIGGEQIAGGQ